MQSVIGRINDSLSVDLSAADSEGEVTVLPTLYVNASSDDINDEIAFSAYSNLSSLGIHVPYSAKNYLARERAHQNTQAEKIMTSSIYPLSSSKTYPVVMSSSAIAGGMGQADTVTKADRATYYNILGLGSTFTVVNQMTLHEARGRWFIGEDPPRVEPALSLGGVYLNYINIPNDWVVIDTASEERHYAYGTRETVVNIYGPNPN